MALGSVGRYGEAVEWLDKAVAFFTSEGDQHREGWSRYELGVVHTRAGHTRAAVALLEKAVSLLAAANDPHTHEKALHALQQARKAAEQAEEDGETPQE
ncbi:tetratricopeptide repeat protein (plasmid) [Thermobifida halotolerans]|uniref:Tetratricopeptide repeat protein n=1 Tax=Thermobifida halotolerans TaxID=483545 RepID=A0A399FVJ5_9ACTN|nr:tetratricopeptide repeat protein [Thermobifida halotolerans]